MRRGAWKEIRKMIEESRVVYVNRPKEAILWGALKVKVGRLLLPSLDHAWTV